MPRIVLAAAPLRDGPTALRPWRDSDLAALVEACQDPEIPRGPRRAIRLLARLGEPDTRCGRCA